MVVLGDCPRGTRFDQSEGKCISCVKDTYQPLPKQDYCIPCSDDLVTFEDKSVTIQECEGNVDFSACTRPNK